MISLVVISQILKAKATGPLDIEVSSITYSSKNCLPATIFVAIKGFRTDGHNFIEAALAQGAVAIISEQTCPEGFKATWLQVTDARKALAAAADIIYGQPTHQLKLVGVTGTNGKTTTATLIDAICQQAYGNSTLITTIRNRIGKLVLPAERTTPEASDTQKYLRQAVDAGCLTACMEVSSQAIDLHRADSLKFAVVVFTNLTQDHLDYHKSMANYFAAKKKLFDGQLLTQEATAILNIDDEHGRQLTEIFAGSVITYGFDPTAQVHPQSYKLSLNGIHVELTTPQGSLTINSNLVGKPHIANIMAAVAAGIALNIELATIQAGIEALASVTGRFDRVESNADFAVIVDYAHTDDALQKVLETAREVSQGRIICLFGCGGDKDQSKRPLMGLAAARYSDLVIITSDNPRSEDPEAIILQAEAGVKSTNTPYFKITDRRAAIQFAIEQAHSGDIVMLTGKGHEDYQILKDGTIHFDDKEVARQILATLKYQAVEA